MIGLFSLLGSRIFQEIMDLYTAFSWNIWKRFALVQKITFWKKQHWGVAPLWFFYYRGHSWNYRRRL